MTTTSQEAFLRAFHAKRPTVTSDGFARGRAPDGRSSYEILCDRVSGRRRVLDLGCGDGPLLELLARTRDRRVAGVDLSPESLALARRRPRLADATLLECRAQNLPFPNAFFDACVSHMALMLMGDVEQVAAEVARVLSLGGVFACTLGGGAAGGEAYELFLDLARPVIMAAPAQQRIPALGDRRIRRRDGLDEILRPVGFGPVDWETVRIDLSGSRDRVWAIMAGLYDLGPLAPSTVLSLQAAFFGEADRLARPDGTVPCAMNLHIATARLER